MARDHPQVLEEKKRERQEQQKREGDHEEPQTNRRCEYSYSSPPHASHSTSDKVLKEPILTEILDGVTSREEAEQTYRKKIRDAAKQTTGEVLPRGGDKRSERAKSISNLEIDSQRERAKKNGVGYQTQINLDRLARDFPPLHEEVKEGKLSVHRASIKAGFIREATRLDKLKNLWTNALHDERAALQGHEIPRRYL